MQVWFRRLTPWRSYERIWLRRRKLTSSPNLSRDLGVRHASAIVVGTIIGSGIFLVPAEMMQAVGSAALVYVAWIVGGILSLAGPSPTPSSGR